MRKRDWRNLAYLANGSKCQRAVYQLLSDLRIFADLAAYRPLLAGTFPLAIESPQSDLDILCEASNLDVLHEDLARLFGHRPDFEIKEKLLRGLPSLIARFKEGGICVEIFGQNQPVEMQYGYLHLVVEWRLLELGGAKVLEAIRSLKQAGWKTEPAFAHVFAITGDPYEQLREMAAWSDGKLLAFVANRSVTGLVPRA